jgi:hypothetical protein
MGTATPPRSMAGSDVRDTSPWATGLTLFAGAVMTVLGINQVFLGIAAIVKDEVYVPLTDYVYGLDLSGWGWIHLAFGILLVATGISVLRGQDWARGVGMGLVSLNMISNFVFIPYAPLWSILLIALDVAILWGLARTSSATY